MSSDGEKSRLKKGFWTGYNILAFLIVIVLTGFALNFFWVVFCDLVLGWRYSAPQWYEDIAWKVRYSIFLGAAVLWLGGTWWFGLKNIKKVVIRNLIPLALLYTAIYQWYGIGERTYHAWWMWYKFKDYGGGGGTDMSYEMVATTYVVSGILILTSFIIRKYVVARSFSSYVNSIAAGMLIIGILWLTCLIISPYATLVK
jgi:hypothetical protein